MEVHSGLIEKLAEKMHDCWMEKRLAEGWGCGPVRDDAKKETPCLVPYEQLPESEKEYDRATARETILALEELGYVAVKKP